SGRTIGVLALELRYAQARQKHVVRWLLLWMVFEDRALKILDKISGRGFGGALDERLGDGIALLRQAAVDVPIVEEEAADCMVGLREVAAGAGQNAESWRLLRVGHAVGV